MISSKTPPASSAASSTNRIFHARDGKQSSLGRYFSTCFATCLNTESHFLPLHKEKDDVNIRVSMIVTLNRSRQLINTVHNFFENFGLKQPKIEQNLLPTFLRLNKSACFLHDSKKSPFLSFQLISSKVVSFFPRPKTSKMFFFIVWLFPYHITWYKNL